MKSIINYFLKLFSINALVVMFIQNALYDPIFKEEQWRCMETRDLVVQLIFGIIVLVFSLRIYLEVLDDKPYFK